MHCDPTSAPPEQIAGVVRVGYDGHRGRLHYLAVDPALKQQGTGRALVRAAEAGLAALGCAKMQLQVRTDNFAVIAFYRNLGYEPYDAIDLGKRMITDAASDTAPLTHQRQTESEDPA